jgi:hypothetical protein
MGVLYTGTFWEFKNDDDGVNRTTASLAHGWAAAPTIQLTEQVLGVTPVGPGYATWKIKPHTGNLKWAKGAVPTKYGDITTSWSAKGGRFALDVRAPAGTTGTIAAPADPDPVVTVNGRTAWAGGTSYAYQAKAVDGHVELTVPNGAYKITVKRG